jgi:glycosyltransferase involved in cell wall biosynthesis
MSRCAVSVVVDTYNHERYIEQAIISVLEQDFPASEMEIVVVDDGSTDRTPGIVRKFAPRVRLLCKKNGGQASAYNAAFPETHGQIISFLDGDDWLLPGKVKAVTEALESQPSACGVGHGYYEIRDSTKQTKIHQPDSEMFVTLQSPAAAKQAFHAWYRILNSAFTVRRGALERILPIDERLTFCADSPVSLAGMALGTVILKEPLAYYRVHASNLHVFEAADGERVRRKNDMMEKMFQVLDRQLLGLGVPPESIAALLYPHWMDVRRFTLRTYGGSRIGAFQTEMRHFHSEFSHPGVGYRLFKYLLVGPATLLLSPRQFYKARDWYARCNLSRLRERLFSKTENLAEKS